MYLTCSSVRDVSEQFFISYNSLWREESSRKSLKAELERFLL